MEMYGNGVKLGTATIREPPRPIQKALQKENGVSCAAARGKMAKTTNDPRIEVDSHLRQNTKISAFVLLRGQNKNQGPDPVICRFHE